MEPTGRDIRATRVLRWLLVPVVAVVGWYAVLFAGLAAVGVLDSLCPRELMVSGSCEATWYRPAFDAMVVSFSGLSAAVVVLAPTVMAPGRKLGVAVCAFVGGAAVALGMCIAEPDLLAECVAALGCGALVLTVLIKKL